MPPHRRGTPILGDDLRKAALEGDVEKVKEVLAAGVDADDTSFNDETALKIASAQGHNAVLEVLLEAGADVLKKDRWKWTALDYAKSQKHASTIKLLAKELQVRAVVWQ